MSKIVLHFAFDVQPRPLPLRPPRPIPLAVLPPAGPLPTPLCPPTPTYPPGVVRPVFVVLEALADPLPRSPPLRPLVLAALVGRLAASVLLRSSSSALRAAASRRACSSRSRRSIACCCAIVSASISAKSWVAPCQLGSRMRRWLCSVAERIRVHVCKSVEAEVTVWFTVCRASVDRESDSLVEHEHAYWFWPSAGSQ